jgi:hypothetical protein
MDDDEFRRFMARINDKLEQILNRLVSVESDFQNTKGFLIGDAALSGRRWLDLEARVTRLEHDLRGKEA